MDESWGSTEGKTISEYVVHTSDLPAIRTSPAEDKHITLIGCIPRKGKAVRPAFIVPSIPQMRNLEANDLDDVKIYDQPSGFQTGEIIAKWIEDVFVPHIDGIRIWPWEHALLIVDAHSSRLHPDAQLALLRNNIDLMILPAHVTSIFQPLDREVFIRYKAELRRLIKGKAGGICKQLWWSLNAFHFATAPQYIKAAWERSNLFTEDQASIINSFVLHDKPVRNNGRSNIVLQCEKTSS